MPAARRVRSPRPSGSNPVGVVSSSYGGAGRGGPLCLGGRRLPRRRRARLGGGTAVQGIRHVHRTVYLAQRARTSAVAGRRSRCRLGVDAVLYPAQQRRNEHVSCPTQHREHHRIAHIFQQRTAAPRRSRRELLAWHRPWGARARDLSRPGRQLGSVRRWRLRDQRFGSGGSSRWSQRSPGHRECRAAGRALDLTP